MTKDYNHEEYIHFRETCTDNGEVIRVDLSYEDISSISLDRIGKQAPDEIGFEMIPNYLLKYWSPTIGSDAVSTLVHLKMFALYSEEYMYTCVSITELSRIMGKNIITVRKYLRILEEYGFIAMFRRLHTSKNNRETSPFIKIRQTVPMLTEEQVLALPKFLQEDHEAYIQQMEVEV